MDPKLLEILVCPETKEPLRPADADLLDRVNRAIALGGVTNRGGEPVTDPLEEALVRVDGKVLYPVRHGIPVMLLEEGLLLDTLP